MRGAKDQLQGALDKAKNSTNLTQAELSKAFGWGADKVTKGASDFTKASLEKMGITRDMLADLQLGYSNVAAASRNLGSPNISAETRAAQMAELMSLFK